MIYHCMLIYTVGLNIISYIGLIYVFSVLVLYVCL